MTSSCIASPSTAPIASASSSRSWLPLPLHLAWAPTAAVLGLLWLLIFNQQRLEWSVNVVYAYGWAVPVMAAYLLSERWRTRRADSAPPAGALVWGGLGAAALLLLAYLPVRVIQEANPDWVKINWSLAGLGVGLTLLALLLQGGVRHALHFAFPLLFCFTALPWPVWMDTWLVQELMRGNAAICAEVLTWSGTPAMAQGNLIQVADRWVNVEEACSGIRSLQTAFMMSLFLGELHRLSVLRRFGLVAASFAIAFLLNIARTLLLTHLTAEPGLADRWHDTIGVVVMLACIAGLWALSEWFRPRVPPLSTAVRPATPAAPASPDAPASVATALVEAVPTVPLVAPAPALTPAAPPRPARLLRLSPFPIWFAAAGVLWLVAAESLTGLWYRWHESRVPPAVAWRVEWPENAPDFDKGEFAERTLALLKFNTGETASWTAEGVYPWQMYSLRWEPGRVSKFLSSSHYPTVCLPATGLQLAAELGPWECVVNGVNIPFSTFLFKQGAENVYVFHAIFEERALNPEKPNHYRQVDTNERLRSVWRGERNLGQHVVGISLTGAASSEDAREIATRVLRPVIRPETTPSPASASSPLATL